MEKFTINVPDAVLADLSERLARTRWPDQVDNAGWDYGTELGYLKRLTDYWRNEFDWRRQERMLNALPQWRVDIEGIGIHFVHVRGVGPAPLPLIITHGWPSSFAEGYEIIAQLADPARYGGDAADAFDVVVPSMPGFGFSDRIQKRGLPQVDRLWRKLMTEVLGYGSFLAHGTDVGARVTSALGRFHGDVVRGIHLGSVDLEWPEPLPPQEELSAAERDYLRRCEKWTREQGAYDALQATTPQTAAYGLNDSPVGLAAWIVEKFRAWSDCGGDIESCFSKDSLLTNITIYWVTETINSSMRRYFEVRHNTAPNPLKLGERIETPTAIAMFPGEKDLVVPREFAERCYNVVRWTDMPVGGHFPAMEEPELLIADLRRFARAFR
ncbi:MAG: epoxide hydrolase [Myxococcaceae bacterium]|nr:epoxide hydrolase [Myxococcaceae bacterium]